jgi:type IV secretory pathway TrbF-like protein
MEFQGNGLPFAHALNHRRDEFGGPEQQMESEFYLQARREWDERYDDLVLGKRNWQIAGLMLLSLVLAVGIVWMSARSKVIPYIPDLNELATSCSAPTVEVGEPRGHGKSSL